MATRTVHVMISGRVQGVGYRAWTRREADRRGLSGCVCNRRNGAVEAVFSGDAEAVDAMLVAVQSGPVCAQVKAVETREGTSVLTGSFEVRAGY